MDTQKQIDAAPPEGADNGEKIFCGKFASVGELAQSRRTGTGSTPSKRQRKSRRPRPRAAA